MAMSHAPLASLVLALVMAPATGWADDPRPPAPAPAPPVSAPGAKSGKDPAPPPPRAATDAEAKALVDGLAAVARKKAPDVLAALSALEGLRHVEFVKPLVKLLTHEDDGVAIGAARQLEIQRPAGPDDKLVAKEVERVGRDVWRNGFQHPTNKGRPVVRGAIVKVAGAWSITLDAKQFDEVKSLWAREMGNPDPRRSDALLHVIAYVEATRDKRFCRMLAEQIEQPVAGNVNDAANPSAAYWEARWRLWEKIGDPAIDVLKALTGQTFATTADAKAWFQANVKTFKFDW